VPSDKRIEIAGHTANEITTALAVSAAFAGRTILAVQPIAPRRSIGTVTTVLAVSTAFAGRTILAVQPITTRRAVGAISRG
jgi:hypothetical protein